MRPPGSSSSFAAPAIAALWGWVAVLPACIDDLPEPTPGAGGMSTTTTMGQGAAAGSMAANGGAGGAVAPCNLPGGAVEQSCLALNGEPPGCSMSKASCYRQDASNCSCGAQCGDATCPDPTQACPNGVKGLGAACVMVPANPGTSACSPCGCARCMQICDGLGPTFAIRPPGSDRLVSWDVDLPASGTLGIYVRARGRFDGMFLGVWGGMSEPFPAPMGGTADPETGFATYIVRNLETWNSPGTAPSEIAIGVSMMNDVVIEIDCVVPFVE